ncbi:hypothetical protein HNR60_000894 [Rhodopseudomonas rhenobacensis]|uniref:Uncharacterized protein n=1 Tax=Rhodopseudomonas rhenobacensis TaxID=87461 RepID=A0A7W7Z1W1_9BRAD|nr:hypothetical protein [Rhodopseudomonas rhenobacensis]MBB5046152.1 hypothetical protein [Rhodopseudomonas rhenobacensis]
MATANNLYEALADATGKSVSAVEAYGLGLRKIRRWPPTKPGRGASPVTLMDSAKLLYVMLSAGPNDIGPFFMEYANTCPLENKDNAILLSVLQAELDLKDDAKFLDYCAAFIAKYRDETIKDVVFWSESPDGMMEESAYPGPHIEMRVQGPFPIGVFKFILSHKMLDRIADAGGDPKQHMGMIVIPFLPEFFRLAAESRKRAENAESKRLRAEHLRSADAFGDAIQALREHRSKGIGFERYLGGREFDAVGRALRGDVLSTG